MPRNRWNERGRDPEGHGPTGHRDEEWRGRRRGRAPYPDDHDNPDDRFRGSRAHGVALGDDRDRFFDERDRPSRFGSDGGWDEAGLAGRPRAPIPSMTVPGAAAGYYAPYLYGSYGGGRPDDDRPRGGQGGGWFGGDPYYMHGHERNFMDKATDEVAAWFGSDEAQARRDKDHRGRGPRNYRRSDARIEEDVNDRLTEDRRVDATDITVSVAEGEVTLDGHVTSRMAKRRAEDLADDVAGVQHVQNNLRVRQSPPDLGADRR